MANFRYSNKRIGARDHGGRFARVTLASSGLGCLVCPNPDCRKLVFYELYRDDRDGDIPDGPFVARATPPSVCPECATSLAQDADPA